MYSIVEKRRGNEFDYRFGLFVDEARRRIVNEDTDLVVVTKVKDRQPYCNIIRKTGMSAPFPRFDYPRVRIKPGTGEMYLPTGKIPYDSILEPPYYGFDHISRYNILKDIPETRISELESRRREF